MGRNEYDKLESALRVLLTHMLKWDHQPEEEAIMENTISEQRDRTDALLDKPRLKTRLTERSVTPTKRAPRVQRNRCDVVLSEEVLRLTRSSNGRCR